MPTSVKLQDMMSYSVILTIIAVVLVLAPVIFLLVFKLIKFKPKKKVKVEKPKPKKHYDPVTLKNMYLEKIKEIETRYSSSLIDMRQAHLDLSKTVREYCAEASDVPVNSLTLNEIERLNVPSLYLLIKEFYAPEFAYEADADIARSFMNAREVVRSWK